MDKYINAKDLKEWIETCLEREDKVWEVEKATLNGVKSKIDSIPASDVRPVVHGKWFGVWWSGERAFGQCSNCHNTGELRTIRNEYGIWNVCMDFCPDCGADMRKTVTS